MNEINNFQIDKTLRVGIYLRLSDEDNDKINKNDDSESIKNQRNLLVDIISKNSNFILVDEYCDEDLSGAGTYRPEFERLIKDCEDRKLDLILCKSQSRFSRDMEFIEKYFHNKFIEWNIRFIGVTDSCDTANPGNKKSRQINGLVNEWYLEDVSNNIRSAFHSKMMQGEYISPFASFGYVVSIKNNNKLLIDPVASEVVKEIFNLYLLGLGFTSIAKKLNSKNIPSPSLYKFQKGIKLNVISNRPREEIKWSANAIKTILKNELYIGNLVQGKRTTVSYKNHKIINKDKIKWIKHANTHQAIISKEIFEKVQVAIEKRTRTSNKIGTVHNFSGKVFCLECGRNLVKKNNSKGLQYLICSNNKGGYNDCINQTSIRYDTLEHIIFNAINNIILNNFDEDILFKEDNNKIKSRYVDIIKNLEIQKLEINKKLSKIKNYLKNLYEDKVNGIINNIQFKDLLEDYSKSECIYKEEIKQIDCDIELYKIKEQDNTINKMIFKKYQKLNKLNRFIVEEFIDNIHVGKIDKKTNTRKIEIIWNFLI